MRKLFFIAFFVAFAFLLPAQTPLYIRFEPECMNQLEYRYTYSGQDVLMYSISKSENELYFFRVSGAAPTTSSALPKNTMGCKNLALSSAEVDAINAGGRLAFIVLKVQNGYLSMPVDAAGQVFRVGTSFAFRSPNYDFVLDTANIDYARNLSQPGVASPVYLTGMRDYDCRRQFSFRLEPLQADMPRTDVEVIPGIGIVSDRTGRNGSEMEQNVYRLLKINGMGMEEFIAANCRGLSTAAGAPGTFITNWPQKTDDHTEPFMEPDKEGYYTQPPAQGGNQLLADCPEKPGFGYHIVQPGETLNSIARIYSLNVQSLIAWNNITEPNKIEVCRKIWLSAQGAAGLNKPGAGQPAAANEHIVQKGESLSGIARKYNIPEATLRQLNSIPASGAVTIYTGQRLVTARKQATITDKQAAVKTPTPLSGPSASSRTQHKVMKGETTASIARKYGYSAEYFRHINRNNKNLPATDDQAIAEGVLLNASDCNCERVDLATFKQKMQSGNSGYDYYSGEGKPNTVFPATANQKTGGFEYIGEYIVKSGDSLQSIARQYGLTAEKLAAANGLKAGQEPRPRDILKIPK